MYHLLKCVCGWENLAKPKQNKTIDEVIELKLCHNCRRKGQWEILSTNEKVWN